MQIKRDWYPVVQCNNTETTKTYLKAQSSQSNRLRNYLSSDNQSTLKSSPLLRFFLLIKFKFINFVTKVCYDVMPQVLPYQRKCCMYLLQKTQYFWSLCVYIHIRIKTHSQHSSHSRFTTNNILCLLLSVIVVLKTRRLRLRR